MKGYEYQSEFARKHYRLGYEQGFAEGLAEGLVELQRCALALAISRFDVVTTDDAATIQTLRDADALLGMTVAIGKSRSFAEARALLAQATVVVVAPAGS